MKRFAILVTGSREWSDRVRLFHALIDATTGRGIVSGDCVLIHGAAPGADTLAGEYARASGMLELPMPAQWHLPGMQRSAGPARNTLMVKTLEALQLCGYECRVLAFPLPGSRGTHDCIAKARRAGFEVTVVEPVS